MPGFCKLDCTHRQVYLFRSLCFNIFLFNKFKRNLGEISLKHESHNLPETVINKAERNDNYNLLLDPFKINFNIHALYQCSYRDLPYYFITY